MYTISDPFAWFLMSRTVRFFVPGHHVPGLEVLSYVDAEVLGGQVTDVPEGGMTR